MGNIALLVLMMAAFGMTSGRSPYDRCFFCPYNFDLKEWPREQLREWSDKIFANLSEDDRIALGETDLNKPELILKQFCAKICSQNRLIATTETAADNDPSAADGSNDGSAQPRGLNYRKGWWPGVKLRTHHTGLIINPFIDDSTPEGSASKRASENAYEGLDRETLALLMASNDNSRSGEAATEEFSDKHKNRSAILLSSGIKYLNAGKVSADAANGGAALGH